MVLSVPQLPVEVPVSVCQRMKELSTGQRDYSTPRCAGQGGAGPPAPELGHLGCSPRPAQP